MHVHCLQHVSFEGLGRIEPWLQARGCRLTWTRFFASSELPDPRELDALIVLGGPMSANDEKELPWLAAEIRFLRECTARGKRLLGICLGAQLIAKAMGARVYPNPVKEIGWWPVQGLASPGGASFRFPDRFDAFHWHGETYDLPPGAVRLARSAACANQAFQLGRTVLGLQFHLEMTPESVREILAHCRADLRPSPFVQSEAVLLAAPPEPFVRSHELLAEVLSYWMGRDG